jgi:hypothetical protein
MTLTQLEGKMKNGELDALSRHNAVPQLSPLLF